MVIVWGISEVQMFQKWLYSELLNLLQPYVVCWLKVTSNITGKVLVAVQLEDQGHKDLLKDFIACI